MWPDLLTPLRDIMQPFELQSNFATILPEMAVPTSAHRFPNTQLKWLNVSLAQSLGVDLDWLRSPQATALLTGQVDIATWQPVAQAYAGHQFGHFNPQLGDGRALLLGEYPLPNGGLVDFHLKGSGPTVFSRGGDGFAVLGPMLREAIMGEALFHMGIPTTRALAIFETGATVYRDRPRPGAILLRVADSHIRVGSFQFAAAYDLAHGNVPISEQLLPRLIVFCIQRHGMGVVQRLSDLGPAEVIEFFVQVVRRQASLIAQWMAYGFIHGVMNTDNLLIGGQSIDFGPCAMMEVYQPSTVFSSIDRHGRYAYDQQPKIAQWNLSRLGQTLVCLGQLTWGLRHQELEKWIEKLQVVVQSFEHEYHRFYLEKMQHKLGENWLAQCGEASIEVGIERWLQKCQADGTDYTQAMHRQNPQRGVNPRVIPRNYAVEQALAEAENQRWQRFEQLIAALTNPFEEPEQWPELLEPAPQNFAANYQTFCGT